MTRPTAHVVREGVVLAAGRGVRLKPVSELLPKPLAPICNKPIMQYQLEAMRDAGIADIAVVVGPGGEAIADYFGDGADLGVRLAYIEDPEPAGIASSLARTEAWTGGPFMVFLGDIMFALEDLTPALAPLEFGAATLVVREDTPDAVRRNFAVVTNDGGRVLRVIEKPSDPPTRLKGCGAYVFDGAIFDAIRRTPRSAIRNEYEITDAIQVLIDMDKPVYAAPVARWDVNVTFPSDLLECNLRVLGEQRLDHLVGQGAHVDSETRLVRSIVGGNATVEAPVEFEECLVLPGGYVSRDTRPLRRHILADGRAWSASVA